MIRVFHVSDKKLREVKLLLDDYQTSLWIKLHMPRTSKELAKAVKLVMRATAYEAVADVDTDDLDVAFRMTNHIDSDWRTNAGVKPIVVDRGVRSSSVGDVFLNLETKTAYVVDRIGFFEIGINKEPFTA